jgi:hypothetical protein
MGVVGVRIGVLVVVGVEVLVCVKVGVDVGPPLWHDAAALVIATANVHTARTLIRVVTMLTASRLQK